MTATVADLRRTVRAAIWRVRCENRAVSRYVFNLAPVVRYRRTQQPSTATVAVVDQLRSRGVATADTAQILEDETLLAAVIERCEKLAADVESTSESTTSAKSFLHQLLGRTPAIDPADPLVQFALHPRIRGVAEDYSQMRLRLQDINVWLTAPSDGEAQHSQRWHRDLPEDHDIVKCFFYVRDVPLGAGPLEYLAGSHTLVERKRQLPTEFDGIGYRISDDAVQRLAGHDRLFVGDAAAGTVVFADTRGLHRGGLARDRERLVLQITYASKATTRQRVLVPADGVSRAQLRDARLLRTRPKTIDGGMIQHLRRRTGAPGSRSFRSSITS